MLTMEIKILKVLKMRYKLKLFYKRRRFVTFQGENQDTEGKTKMTIKDIFAGI